MFNHVESKLLSSNELLFGCGPLLDWLRRNLCIHVVDGKNEGIDDYVLRDALKFILV